VRVDLVPQWDLQHESPAQSLACDVPFHQLAHRCALWQASWCCQSLIGSSRCGFDAQQSLAGNVPFQPLARRCALLASLSVLPISKWIKQMRALTAQQSLAGNLPFHQLPRRRAMQPFCRANLTSG